MFEECYQWRLSLRTQHMERGTEICSPTVAKNVASRRKLRFSADCVSTSAPFVPDNAFASSNVGSCQIKLRVTPRAGFCMSCPRPPRVTFREERRGRLFPWSWQHLTRAAAVAEKLEVAMSKLRITEKHCCSELWLMHLACLFPTVRVSAVTQGSVSGSPQMWTLCSTDWKSTSFNLELTWLQKKKKKKLSWI